MGFDADAYRAAWVPWTITLDGVTYTERPISVDVVRRFKTDLESANGDGGRLATERLLRAAFPWRPHYVWRGNPVAKMLALDDVTRQAALADFFAVLDQRWRSRTTGADSKPPTEIPLPPAGG